MHLADLAATSAAVAATRSRLEKRALLADLLKAAPADEVELVATYLSGTLRQRRTGVGWRGVSDLPDPALEPSLGLLEVDAVLEGLSLMSGTGSSLARKAALGDLFGHRLYPKKPHVPPIVGQVFRRPLLM